MSPELDPIGLATKLSVFTGPYWSSYQAVCPEVDPIGQRTNPFECNVYQECGQQMAEQIIYLTFHILNIFLSLLPLSCFNSLFFQLVDIYIYILI